MEGVSQSDVWASQIEIVDGLYAPEGRTSEERVAGCGHRGN